MASSSDTLILPSVELRQTPPATLYARHLTTLNGKLHWITVVSKTGDNVNRHHLTQEHWNAVATSLQRVVLAHIDNQSNTDPISFRQLDLLEVSVGNGETIHYTSAKKEYTFSTQELQHLKTHKGHDLLDAIHQTIKKLPVNPYFTKAQEQEQTQHLATAAADYQTKHPLIRSLYTNLEEDITAEAFNFYVKELQHADNTPVLAEAEKIDVNSLDFSKPLFLSLRAHAIEKAFKDQPPLLSKHAYLIGVWIDMNAHQVIIYDPASDQKTVERYAALDSLIEKLQVKDPQIQILYQGSKKKSKKEEKPQEKRALLRFLQLMISTSAKERLTRLQKELKKNGVNRYQEIAEKIHTNYIRLYERLNALGVVLDKT